MAVVLGLLLRGDRLAPASTDPGHERELESLLAAQREDGFIGHTIFWDRPVSLSRLPFYNVASRRSLQTETIQPPLLAWAWRIAVGDPAAEPRIAAQVEWLARQPRPRGRRAALDRPAGRVRPRRLAQVRPGLGPAGQRADRLSAAWSGATAGSASTRARIREGGGPRALRGAGQHAAGRSRCRRSAGPPRPRRSSSGSGTSAAGLFVDEVQPGGARPRALTWAALAPLALPDLPEEIGRRLVEEHLLTPREFRPRSRRPRWRSREPSYEPGGGRGPIRRYWRGPTWVNSAWMVWIGLRRLGYEAGGGATGRGPDRRGRARRAARVLRPARRHRPRRRGLRLVGPDRRDRPNSRLARTQGAWRALHASDRGRRRTAICSGR